MLLRHAPSILLDVVDLQERDRIVAFLTAEHGKKRGVAKGARTKFSRFAGQLQPLAKAQVSWVEKEGRELVRISEVQLIRPAAPLHQDLEGILLTAYLAEHMDQLVMEDEASSPFFRLLDTTLEALLAGVDRSLAARYFETWVLRLSGVFPVPRECPLCGSELAGRAELLEAEGALVCPTCAEGHGSLGVGPGELEFLRRSGRLDLPALAGDPPPPAVLGHLEELHSRVRRHFLQAELRSYRVMRDTLG
ncbi:MAG: DNA repair protein RecO [Holophagales bacterium]|nr:DNA repair protein RecO [Holophagales bacterium]